MNRTIGAGHYLTPIKESDASAAVAEATERGYYTLAVATYYIDVPVMSATSTSLHLQWSSALIGVITFESCDMGAGEVSLTSTTTGDWIQQNPAAAVVPIIGTGASVTALTITLAGGGAGGCEVNISALAFARLRIKAVISTGGALRTAHFGKE